MTNTSNTAPTLTAAQIASAAAEANKGKSVRATALKPGSAYVMARWTAPKLYAEVTFIGFGTDLNALGAPGMQLKQITAAHKFAFRSGDETLVADGRCAGNVFIGEGAGVRCTFFEQLVSTVAVTAQPEEQAPVATPAEGEAEAVIEQAPVQAEDVVTIEDVAVQSDEEPGEYVDVAGGALDNTLTVAPVAHTVEVSVAGKASNKGKGRGKGKAAVTAPVEGELVEA